MAKYWKNKKFWQKDKEREAVEKIKHLSLTQVEEKIINLKSKLNNIKDTNIINKECFYKNIPKIIKMYQKIWSYKKHISEINEDKINSIKIKINIKTICKKI